MGTKHNSNIGRFVDLIIQNISKKQFQVFVMINLGPTSQSLLSKVVMQVRFYKVGLVVINDH